MSQKQQNFSEKACEMLNVDLQDENKPWLTSIESLMKLIGVLGMALPILLWLFLLISTGRLEELESISHYFYTRSNPIFIIILSLMAIFLMIYKRDKPIDFFLSFFAGLCALIVVILPTDPIITNCSEFCINTTCPNLNEPCNSIEFADNYVMAYVEDNSIRQWIHYGAAAFFLVILNYMCYFLFTRTDETIKMTKEKEKRNLVYYLCGGTMTFALLVIFAKLLNWIPAEWYYTNNVTFWMESVAVEAFGFSWLVKGGFILKDKKKNDKKDN